MIRFWCDICGKVFTSIDRNAGKKWICSRCGHIIDIPVPKSGTPLAESMRRDARKGKASKSHRKRRSQTRSKAKAAPAPGAGKPTKSRAAKLKSVSGASSSIKAQAKKQRLNPKDGAADPGGSRRQCSYRPPPGVGIFGMIPKFVYVSGAAIILTVISLLYFFLR